MAWFVNSAGPVANLLALDPSSTLLNLVANFARRPTAMTYDPHRIPAMRYIKCMCTGPSRAALAHHHSIDPIRIVLSYMLVFPAGGAPPRALRCPARRSGRAAGRRPR
eukprot:SAG31_NODE_6113_length_2165_cov_8.036302_3_plen_107_part_01